MSISKQGRIRDTEELIIEYRRRLQKLQEQKARHGLKTPAHILAEIEDIEASIEELRQELENLQKAQPEKAPRVKIILKEDISAVSNERWQAAIDAFAAVMGISPNDIEIFEIYEG